MAKIKLVELNTLIPEGTYIFKINEVNYDEEFGKIDIKMTNDKGRHYTETFKLINQLGVNEGAMKAFSFFAKTALNDFEKEEIDHEDLVGHYIELDLKHTTVPSSKNNGETVTFVNSTGKRVANGFNNDNSVDDLLK